MTDIYFPGKISDETTDKDHLPSMMLKLNATTNLPDDILSSSREPFDGSETNETILIVDDEEIVRRFHLQCLSPRYRCVEAASAEEALDILNKEPVSLVVTDWVMTGMSGKMLLCRIVRDFPDTFVIMITGIGAQDRALDAMRLGAFDYLLKPSQPDIIEFTVARALALRTLTVASRRCQIDLELQKVEFEKQRAELEGLRKQQAACSERPAPVDPPVEETARELGGQVKTVSRNLLALERHLRDIRAFIDPDERADFEESDRVEKTVESAMRLLAGCTDAAERLSGLVEKLRASM